MDTHKRIDDDCSIDDAGFSVRVRNCLHLEGFKTVGEVRAHMDDIDFIRRLRKHTPNFGKVCFRELNEVIGTSHQSASTILKYRISAILAGQPSDVVISVLNELLSAHTRHQPPSDAP